MDCQEEMLPNNCRRESTMLGVFLRCLLGTLSMYKNSLCRWCFGWGERSHLDFEVVNVQRVPRHARGPLLCLQGLEHITIEMFQLFLAKAAENVQKVFLWHLENVSAASVSFRCWQNEYLQTDTRPRNSRKFHDKNLIFISDMANMFVSALTFASGNSRWGCLVVFLPSFSLYLYARLDPRILMTTYQFMPLFPFLSIGKITAG